MSASWPLRIHNTGALHAAPAAELDGRGADARLPRLGGPLPGGRPRGRCPDPAPPGRKPLGPIDPSNKANLPQPPPSEACERGNTAPASAPASPSVTDVMAAVLHACCGSPLPKSPPATPATEGEGDTLPATEILLSPDIKLRIKMAVPVGAVITVLLAIAVYNYLKE